ncbi:MAG: biotin/lipoyl-binding protein [Pseudomonadota bacterium]
MLEFLICSSLTILPDYLLRRVVQGKRWGREITLFTMWHELRWGISLCVMLTVSLITTIFYFHPGTADAASFFRTVTILPEAPGRVDDVRVRNNDLVEAGDVIFTIDDASQQAALRTAQRNVEEADARIAGAEADLHAAEAAVEAARAAYQQTLEELETKQTLAERGSAAVSEREVRRLEIRLTGDQARIDAAQAQADAVAVQAEQVLPAARAVALASQEQAQAELDKTVVRAGVSGRVEQFSLQVGDYISAILRPAGILVPQGEADGAGHRAVQAGFGQISAQVIQPGMAAEITCVSKPFVIIPMIVVGTQDVIAAGQFRPGDALVDLQDRARPGTLGVRLEPLYADGLDGVLPGSKCVANVYSYHHERLQDPDIGFGEWAFLHVVDATGLIHALILRFQAFMLPVRSLVLTGGH